MGGGFEMRLSIGGDDQKARDVGGDVGVHEGLPWGRGWGMDLGLIRNMKVCVGRGWM